MPLQGGQTFNCKLIDCQEETAKINIVFVQNIWREYNGVMMLSAVLKQNGIKTAVVIEFSPSRAARKALMLDPDLVAFSFTNCEREFALHTARCIKKLDPSMPIAVGGPDPTLSPELVQKDEIDFLCRGEGEKAFVELIKAISKKSPVDGIRGIWTKNQNPDPPPLIENLDTLPLPDRDIYYKPYPFLASNPVKFVFTGRGCPWSCSFCFNKTFRNLYPNKNKYMRHFSVERIIIETKELVGRYGAKLIRFEDDLFTWNKDWLFHFLEQYRANIDLPYLCYIRAGIDEETVSALKQSGCRYTLFGIETGDQQARNTLLKKHITNDQIKETANLLHKYRIHFFTTNMLGLPGETWALALKTLRLNQKIGVKDVWCSVFQPYAGLPLTKQAVSNGELSSQGGGNIGFNTFDTSTIKSPDIERIFNLQKFFYPLVRWPWLEPLLLPLTRFPRNPFFHYIFVLFYVISYRKHSGVSYLRLFQEGFYWFRVFLQGKQST